MAKVKLGEVSKEHKETLKGSKNGYKIVGLEHLTPETITLSNWDENKENTFTKVFHKGQVLFARRRAYLKKAVLAPFDGICSGDITVIEAIPEKINPDLLPFIIQNDRLFEFAVEKSAGSLSPRVKWEHLKDYEFELPSIEEQERLAKILWAAEEVKQKYKLAFGMVGNAKASYAEEIFALKLEKECVSLGDISELANGIGFSNKYQGYLDYLIPFYKVSDMNTKGNEKKLNVSNNYVNEEILRLIKKNAFDRDGIVFAKVGAAVFLERKRIVESPFMIDNNMMVIFPNDDVDIKYLYHFLCYIKLSQYVQDGPLPSLNSKNIKSIRLPIMPIDGQNIIADNLDVFDRNIANIIMNIESINQLQKNIINSSGGVNNV